MATITPDNHGPVLNVAMWIILGPMAITAFLKVYTKYKMIQKLEPDDFFMLFAMVY
jgi:hypothetical protein